MALSSRVLRTRNMRHLTATHPTSISWEVRRPSPGVRPLPRAEATTTSVLYWGSIDSYNTLTFLSNGSVVGTFTGSQFPPAGGAQTAADANEYVDFLFSNGASYNSVALSTTSANFELDNLAYGNVAATPEPSSLLLLGTGLLSAVGVARKRFA